ncbi:hypothetical protein TL16_g08095 [Triparma laevis f. inornata]|uniref:Multifunctional methyltransferase subunit TRM112-like protein n=2 Tax=Triparma laevis TaxID=1534972 RepID=A0A9W6ZDA4_9STRA|nr:hypothetical protein TrLO_g13904 [Triparma laevis f. longispina]GMH79292.1 hypothetical protein TL16_g08095 [Triparma laevis f. inornata]
MKLLTHNHLRCNTSSATTGYPLKITPTEIRITDDEYNETFVKHVMQNVNWPVLVQAASQCGITTLPPTLPPSLTTDPSFLRALHHVLVNVNIVSGVLKCPDTGREFGVKDGVCDFMLEEEECENVKI